MDAVTEQAAKVLTESQEAVAHTVSQYADELQDIYNDVRLGGDMEKREALREILASLDAWKKAGNDFLASLSRE